MLPSLLDRWSEVSAGLRGRRFGLFLDYDGTLTPLRARPEDATLDEAQRQRVRRVAERLPVAVVTGRGMADVRRMVRLPTLTYAANHGLEIVGPDFAFEVDPSLRPTFAEVGRVMAEAAARWEGAVVESKGYSVAVHVRLVSAEGEAALQAAVDELVARHEGVRKTTGKKVIELRPTVQWHKGAAVQWLAERRGLDTTIYLGDDRTDEDALAIADIPVVVGTPDWPSAARLSLPDPDAVGTVLERFTALA